MAVQTDIHWEVTDTYGGEANYAWVKRGIIAGKPSESFSDLAAVRRVKAAIGWAGVRCATQNDGVSSIILRPIGVSQVCFIAFHEHGSAS